MSIEYCTSYCVQCGKEPTVRGGHVHRPFFDDVIIAGLCDDCFGKLKSKPCEHPRPGVEFGCFGNWQPWHGIEIYELPPSKGVITRPADMTD